MRIRLWLQWITSCLQKRQTPMNSFTHVNNWNVNVCRSVGYVTLPSFLVFFLITVYYILCLAPLSCEYHGNLSRTFTFWNTCFVSGSICHNVLEYVFNRKTWFSAKHKYVMGDIALIFTLDMKSSTFYISFKPGRIKPWFKQVLPESLKGLRNGWPFRKKTCIFVNDLTKFWANLQ